MKKIVLFSVFSSIIMLSCTMNKRNLFGIYSFKGENVIDTLIIKKNIYIHKIYDKNLRLMYQGKDQWSFDGGRVTLLRFYNNEDNELVEPLSSEDAKNFLMITSFPIYKQNKEIIMEVNADENILYKNTLSD